MFDKAATLKYHVFRDYNVQFDEKGATCGTVRLVQWVREDNEPDETKAKVEIRHVSIKDTEEIPLKGYSFSTPEGPGELVKGMIEAGFGDTKEILKAVVKRDDFKQAVETFDQEEDLGTEGETFDMRDLLLRLSTESDEEEMADAS